MKAVKPYKGVHWKYMRKLLRGEKRKWKKVG